MRSFLLLAILMAYGPITTAPDTAIPGSVAVTYTYGSHSQPRRVPGIQTTYWASLQPYDEETLILKLSERPVRNAPNLLEPRIWHGIQPFFFSGRDFTDASPVFSYGLTREISLHRGRHPNLKARVSVRAFRIGPDGRIRSLSLAVAVVHR